MKIVVDYSVKTLYKSHVLEIIQILGYKYGPTAIISEARQK